MKSRDHFLNRLSPLYEIAIIYQQTLYFYFLFQKEYVENAGAAPPHLHFFLRLGSSAAMLCFFSFCGWVAQCLLAFGRSAAVCFWMRFAIPWERLFCLRRPQQKTNKRQHFIPTQFKNTHTHTTKLASYGRFDLEIGIGLTFWPICFYN